MPIVESLHIHPVKSCRAHDLKSFELDRLGPVNDRRWMIISAKPDGTAITQRAHPRLTLLQVTPNPDQSITLSVPGFESIDVERAKLEASPSTREARLWGKTLQALDAGDSTAEWLSRFLEEDVRLVGIPESYQYFTSDSKTDQTAFTDGFPILIISQASLDELNHRLDFPVEMQRFRPNIVIGDCEPFEEDSWNRIRIENTILRASGPCSRCILTTNDPFSGTREGREPLATLSQYRKTEKGVIFGQNYTNESKSGRIDVGMRIEIL